MYTASRPLVERYLAHTSATLAKSASTVLDGFGVSFEFGFVGNGHRLEDRLFSPEPSGLSVSSVALRPVPG